MGVAHHTPCRRDQACDRGVVIVNVTQCLRGGVQSHYATGTALIRAGVVAGGDMTTEAALTKLQFLLGRNMSPSVIRRLMQTDLRGEITVRAASPCIPWPLLPADPAYSSSLYFPGGGRFDPPRRPQPRPHPLRVPDAAGGPAARGGRQRRAPTSRHPGNLTHARARAAELCGRCGMHTLSLCSLRPHTHSCGGGQRLGT